MADTTAYATALLARLAQLTGRPMPATPANLQWLADWAAREGTSAENNLLATTQSAPGATNFNSVGVKNYPTLEVGVDAAAQTLVNGNYGNILDALASGDAVGADTSGQLASDLHTWSAGPNAPMSKGYTSVVSSSNLSQQRYDTATKAGVRVAGGPQPADAPVTGDETQDVLSGDIDGMLQSQAPAIAQALRSDPQAAALLNEWAQNKLSDQEFQTQLEATDWWRKTPLSQRQVLVGKATDPASLNQRIAQQAATIDTAAKQMGVGLPGGSEYQLAVQAVSNGWDNATIQQKLAGFYQAGSAQSRTGQAGDVGAQIAGFYHDYALPSNSVDIAAKTREVLAGTQNVDDLKTMLADQAKALYGANPNLASALDRGQTVQQYMSTYANIAANMGVVADPNQIDWLNPKWNKALTGQVDPKTGVFGAMSPLQWQKTLMTDPTYGYWKTANGIDAGAQIGTALKQVFAGQGSVG